MGLFQLFIKVLTELPPSDPMEIWGDRAQRGHEVESKDSRVTQSWFPMLFLSLAGCVTAGKLSKLSEPISSFIK